MPDLITVKNAAGETKSLLAEELTAGSFAQIVKVAFGGDAVATPVTGADPLPVADGDAATALADLATAQTATNELLADLIAASGGVAAEVKHAVINESTSGDRTIVAAVATKKIRVLSYHFVVAAPVTLTWKSGPTALTGAESFASLSGIAANGSANAPVLSTAAGAALVLNLGSAVQVSGNLSYIEE